MRFLKWVYLTPVTWVGWQFGVLRWCQVALGVLLGAAFAEFWTPHLWLVGLVCAATAVWSGVMYFRAMGSAALSQKPQGDDAPHQEYQDRHLAGGPGRV